jgi:hypothetical protein
MRIKTLLAAFVLTALPGFAYAQCSLGSANDVTMSCAQGSTWDADAQSCVPGVSS